MLWDLPCTRSCPELAGGGQGAALPQQGWVFPQMGRNLYKVKVSECATLPFAQQYINKKQLACSAQKLVVGRVWAVRLLQLLLRASVWRQLLTVRDPSLVMVPAPRRQEFKCLLFLRVTFPNSEVLLSVCDHCSAAWRVYRAWAFLLLVILGPFFLSCIRKNLHWFFYLLIYLTFLFKMKPHIRRRIFCEKCPVCLLFGILLKWIKSILNLPTEWFDYALTQVCITFEDSKYD